MNARSARSNVVAPTEVEEIENPGDWEVIADGADGPMGLRFVVSVEPDATHALIQAAQCEGLTARAYIQRLVTRAVVELQQHEARRAS